MCVCVCATYPELGWFVARNSKFTPRNKKMRIMSVNSREIFLEVCVWFVCVCVYVCVVCVCVSVCVSVCECVGVGCEGVSWVCACECVYMSVCVCVCVCVCACVHDSVETTPYAQHPA